MSEEAPLSEARDPASIATLIELAEELRQYRALATRDGFRLASLYRRALDLPEAPLGLVINIIGTMLIPDCVALRADPESHPHSGTLRDILAEWLDSLSESQLWEVRPEVIKVAISHLLAAPTDNALYTVMAAGYRSEEVEDAIWSVAASETDCRDTALRILSFSHDANVRSRVSQRIRELLRTNADSVELLNAVTQLAEPDAVEVLFENAKRPERWFRFARFGWLCDRFPGDLDLQERIAKKIVELAEMLPNGWRAMVFEGNVLAKCRTPLALDYLAQHLPDIVEGNGTFNLDDRFHAIDSEIQLRRLVGGELDVDVLSLQSHAVLSSSQEGSWKSEGAYRKDGAWSTAMFFGSARVFEWSDEGVSTETNPLQQHHLMELLSVFSLPTLPRLCRGLLEDRSLEFRNTDDQRLLPFLAAARLAASRSTLDSLELLVNSAGLIRGGPFRTPVDGAADLAAWLYNGRERGEVLNVLERALESDAPMPRNASLRAYRRILSKFRSAQLPDRMLDRLFEIARTPTEKSHLRADAIASLAIAKYAPSGEVLSATLIELTKEADAVVCFEAAIALISVSPTFESLPALEACARRSNAGKPFDGQVAPKDLSDREAYLIGRLAVLWPDIFADDAALLIKFSFSIASQQVIHGIADQLAEGEKPVGKLMDALVDRVRQGESAISASMHVIEAIGKFDTQRLTAEEWEGLWDEWMPDSRAAIADAIGRGCASLSGDSSDRAVNLCLKLLGDSVYAVRRSAGRALGLLSPAVLEKKCNEWILSGSILARMRAAEALGWLPSDDARTIDNRLQRSLNMDLERRVRNAVERSRDDLQSRERARGLLDTLTNCVISDENTWVLQHYAVGIAFSRLGDDFAARELQQRIERRHLAPNIRQFFRRILEDLDKQWRQTTRKWPEPWLPWKGSVEQRHGILQYGSSSYPAFFTLWQTITSGEEPRLTWGGSIAVENGDKFWALRTIMTGERASVSIKIVGRNTANAVFVNLTGSEVIFSGSGAYPTETPSA